MLASNQPYQRVDDGIGAGFITGGIMGGAAAGATHLWGKKGIDAFRNSANGKLAESQKAMDAVNGSTSLKDMKAAASSHQAVSSKHANAMKHAGRADRIHAKSFGGSGKRKAAAYAGSVLAGGILGGFTDGVF
jgi:hypothetical protein